MKILSATVYAFGSYSKLEFSFDNNGLCLISGPTGAGKSTLCDVIPWVLFGRTSKDGAVDEVRQWNSSLPTTGVLTLEVHGEVYKITRIRGDKSANDLILSNGSSDIRGKDLNDTQKIINNTLGMDLDVYLSGAYFHEFSQTAQFFSLPAKKRREITEQMADLTMASSLSDKLIEYRKDLKKELHDLNVKADKLQTKLENLNEYNEIEKKRETEWESNRNRSVVALEKEKYNFDSDKATRIKQIKKTHLEKRVEFEYDLAELEKTIKSDAYFGEKYLELESRKAALGDDKCSECGAFKNSDRHMIITKAKYDLEREESDNEQKQILFTRLNASKVKHLDTLEPLVAEEMRRTNNYGEQLKAMRRELNPHTKVIEKQLEQEKHIKNDIKETKASIAEFSVELADVELLQEVASTFRSTIVKRTIVELENNTNRLLTDHFDGEIRVAFDIAEADKLEVVVTKDGNTCYYTQLSKGQRQLLKLCFAVSVMRSVSNHNGIAFNCIFLDEVFSGLDESLKAKGYSLLHTLETQYSSVFVIDHSTELKSMFTNEYQVSLVSGESILGQAQ